MMLMTKVTHIYMDGVEGLCQKVPNPLTAERRPPIFDLLCCRGPNHNGPLLLAGFANIVRNKTALEDRVIQFFNHTKRYLKLRNPKFTQLPIQKGTFDFYLPYFQIFIPLFNDGKSVDEYLMCKIKFMKIISNDPTIDRHEALMQCEIKFEAESCWFHILGNVRFWYKYKLDRRKKTKSNRKLTKNDKQNLSALAIETLKQIQSCSSFEEIEVIASFFNWICSFKKFENHISDANVSTIVLDLKPTPLQDYVQNCDLVEFSKSDELEYLKTSPEFDDKGEDLEKFAWKNNDSTTFVTYQPFKNYPKYNLSLVDVFGSVWMGIEPYGLGHDTNVAVSKPSVLNDYDHVDSVIFLGSKFKIITLFADLSLGARLCKTNVINETLNYILKHNTTYFALNCRFDVASKGLAKEYNSMLKLQAELNSTQHAKKIAKEIKNKTSEVAIDDLEFDLQDLFSDMLILIAVEMNSFDPEEVFNRKTLVAMYDTWNQEPQIKLSKKDITALHNKGKSKSARLRKNTVFRQHIKQWLNYEIEKRQPASFDDL